jgi:hypothetical protein
MLVAGAVTGRLQTSENGVHGSYVAVVQPLMLEPLNKRRWFALRVLFTLPRSFSACRAVRGRSEGRPALLRRLVSCGRSLFE